MRKIREVLRLKASGHGVRQIGRSCAIATSTVNDYLKRAQAASVGWPLPEGIGESELKRLLFPNVQGPSPEALRPVPDWAQVHKELRRKGVTRRLLWEEYRAEQPEGYRYSQYCEHYRRWTKSVDVSMRQAHRAGEKLFVDYAGMKMPVINAQTGQGRDAEIFVATLGASQYLYAEATWTQQMPDWIGSHVRTFEYLGGVSEIVVPDNLKSGVSKACRYEPDLNAGYAAMAAHYGIAVIPARPYKPKDKAKVESGVQIIEREVLAKLRDRRFLSLYALNQAIRELLEKVNRRPFRKLNVSRRELFEQLEQDQLKPLPAIRYEYARHHFPRVNIDYHIEADRHYYSVPYALRGCVVEARLTSRTLEVFHDGKRVASHIRSLAKGGYTTDVNHMPESHRKHLEWSPSRLIQWAGKIGPECARTAKRIIETREHPEQGYRACLGIMRLSKGYSAQRVEAACRRALVMDVCSYQSIKSILKTGADAQPLPETAAVPSTESRHHQNIRGNHYYGPACESTVRKGVAHA